MSDTTIVKRNAFTAAGTGGRNPTAGSGYFRKGIDHPCNAIHIYEPFGGGA